MSEQVKVKNCNNFYPSPDILRSYAEPNEHDELRQDSDGNLMTRSPVLTDEGSFRDDFSGSSLDSSLTGTVTFTNGSALISGSGTAFLSEVNENNLIKLSTDSADYFAKVYSLISDEELILEEEYSGSDGSGTATKTKWARDIGSGGSISVASSEIVIATGTTSGAETHVYRFIDYGPMRSLGRLKLSQRIANQEFKYGYLDTIDSPNEAAYFLFSGTDNTQVTCISRSSTSASDLESTTVTLPNSSTTASYADYYVDIQIDQVAFYINSTQVALHKNHLPGPYTGMLLNICGKNTGTAASSTNYTCDFLSTINLNHVEIQNTFNASPVFVATQEDIHTLTGTITTTTTNADQVICSLTVPTNKTLYIVGYCIATQNIGGTVKVGKNTVTTVPAGPGTVDSVIFRCIKTADWGVSSTAVVQEDFGGNPRRIGYSGDTVKITVTPKGSTSTIWVASLDYVLR